MLLNLLCAFKRVLYLILSFKKYLLIEMRQFSKLEQNKANVIFC